jgi:hypothetical protein
MLYYMQNIKIKNRFCVNKLLTPLYPTQKGIMGYNFFIVARVEPRP